MDINNNTIIKANKPAESKYLNVSTPWNSVNEVNAGILEEYRYTGLTVNIGGNEYWYKNGVTDGNLILKSIGNGNITVSNGLTENNQIISLGGTLTGDTIFNGGVGMYTLQYAENYSSNFNDRSLVDKRYVDLIGGGIRPKQAVTVATTANISLTGLQTIDGVSVTAGMRVLVKNQNNAYDNGIYVVSSGMWSRATDFDSTNDVVSGSYMFVLSGNTSKYYSYVLTTPDPIDVGVDNLDFVVFTRLNGIVASTGVTVNYVNGEYVISIDGSNLVGDGLIWFNDKFNLNPNVNNVGLYGVTGVTNGIRKYDNHNISLGGELTGTTKISLPYSSNTKFQVGNGDFSGNWYGGILLASRNNTTIGDNYSLIGSRIDNSNYSMIRSNSSSGLTLCSVINNIPRTIYLNNNGLEYAACYHSTYNNRSVVDKEFVTNYSVSGATNGLFLTNNKIKLGGNLTENTIINTCNLNYKVRTESTELGLYNLSLNSKYNTSSFSLCSSDSGTTGSYWNVNGNNNCLKLSHWENNNNGNDLLVRNYDILLLNKTAGITREVRLNNNALNYGDDYSLCYTNRSLVDKEYVTKTISGTSNILNTKIVGSPYTTERFDDVIGVSGTSDIYLYPTPLLGQRITVVDVCGNALLDNITIDGNGYNINNNGTSLINTDFGAITYVFNGLFWSAISFVN